MRSGSNPSPARRPSPPPISAAELRRHCHLRSAGDEWPRMARAREESEKKLPTTTRQRMRASLRPHHRVAAVREVPSHSDLAAELVFIRWIAALPSAHVLPAAVTNEARRRESGRVGIARVDVDGHTQIGRPCASQAALSSRAKASRPGGVAPLRNGDSHTTAKHHVRLGPSDRARAVRGQPPVGIPPQSASSLRASRRGRLRNDATGGMHAPPVCARGSRGRARAQVRCPRRVSCAASRPRLRGFLIQA